MKDPGRTITCMDRAPILGATVENTKVNTTWTRNMGMECITGLMVEGMKGSGVMASNMEKANISYRMASQRLAYGKMASVSDGSITLTLVQALLKTMTND